MEAHQTRRGPSYRRKSKSNRPRLLHHRRNRRQRVALEAVVHIDKSLGGAATASSFLNQAGASRATFRVGVFDLAVRTEQLHGFLVFAARLQEQASGEEIRAGAAAGQGELLA